MESNGDYSKRSPFRNPESPGAFQHGFFVTVAGPDATPYPSEGSSPNVYYARRVRNVSYAQTVGQQEVTYELSGQYVFVCNLEPEKYIEEGSLIKCWHENGRWWTIDKTQPGWLWVASDISGTGGAAYSLAAYRATDGVVQATLQTSSTGASRYVRFGGGQTAWSQGTQTTPLGGGFSRWTRSGAHIGHTATSVSDPAFDSDGNMYGVRPGVGIVKFESSGTLLGTVVSDSGMIAFSYLAIDTSGNIIFRDARTIASGGIGVRKYTSGGSTVWTYSLQGIVSGNEYANVSVDADGAVYVKGRKLDPDDGSEVWNVTSGFDNFTTNTIGADGYLYCSTISMLRKLDPSDGSRIWKAEAAKVSTYNSSPNADEPASGFLVPGIAVKGAAVYTCCNRSSGGGSEPTVRRFNATTGAQEWGVDTERTCWSIAIAPGIAPVFQ